ncbi:MAG: FAD:protein FMN transferase [Gammaproteobacteria bacterium]|nr:FAD:protein FMN transferase [Gammaproteobacteria bacterium]
MHNSSLAKTRREYIHVGSMAASLRPSVSAKEESSLSLRAKVAWILILFIILTACQTNNNTLTRSQFLAFGTIIDISIYGVTKPRAQQAIDELEQRFKQWHQAWHPWQGNGDLYQLNQALGRGENVTIPPSLQPLFQQATELSKRSQGLFDPAIGTIIRAWGFSQDAAPVKPPSDKKIKQLLSQHISLAELNQEPDQLNSQGHPVQLDFGAYAKGYAIDLAIAYLQQQGIDNAIINAGGDLRAIGRHGERPWRIGIRHPRQPGILAAIDIEQDMSVFTSGDYERNFSYEGKNYHHIIDPRTGYPARQTRSVTVIHSNAATADAAATALFIAGPQHWQEIAKAMRVQDVMLIDAQGQIQLSPTMQKHVQFTESGSHTIIVSQAP